jgi:hypothetical protein
MEIAISVAGLGIISYDSAYPPRVGIGSGCSNQVGSKSSGTTQPTSDQSPPC